MLGLWSLNIELKFYGLKHRTERIVPITRSLEPTDMIQISDCICTQEY